MIDSLRLEIIFIFFILMIILSSLMMFTIKIFLWLYNKLENYIYKKLKL